MKAKNIYEVVARLTDNMTSEKAIFILDDMKKDRSDDDVAISFPSGDSTHESEFLAVIYGFRPEEKEGTFVNLTVTQARQLKNILDFMLPALPTKK